MKKCPYFHWPLFSLSNNFSCQVRYDNTLVTDDWRIASTECQDANGRLVRLTEGSEDLYESLAEANGGPSDASYWIGGHIPALGN